MDRTATSIALAVLMTLGLLREGYAQESEAAILTPVIEFSVARDEELTLLFELKSDGTLEKGPAWSTSQAAAREFIDWLEYYWANSPGQRQCE